MLRFIGAALILGGSTALGLACRAQLQKKTETIAAVLGMLDRMESELSCRLTPLPALIKSLADTSGKPLGTVLNRCRNRLGEPERQPFWEIWRGSVARSADLPLGEEERRSLEELGKMLGRYDLDGQLRAIQSARAGISRSLHRAEGERDRLGRVFTVLGVSMGAMLVLLLL